MGGILWLFDTCGFIIGPGIILTGLVAVGLCLRATLRLAPEARRRALVAAVAPAGVGVLGAIFGLVVWGIDGAAGNPAAPLGKVILAGTVVSAVPLAWAALLPRQAVAA